MSATDAVLLLASASPRRSELLRQIGVVFTVVPANIDERMLPGETPRQLVARLASEKAAAARHSHCSALAALGADTIVVCRGQIHDKPTDREHAMRILDALSGVTHSVYSSVCIQDGVRSLCSTTETRVTFCELSTKDKEAYWASGEPLGKAGGYAIQGLGAVFVTRIEGSYSGVVGLPLAETAKLLEAFAIPFWRTGAVVQ